MPWNFNLLSSTCLKPTFSLRRQLVISYGSTALLSIGLVVLLAVASALISQDVVMGSGITESMSLQLNNGLRDSSVQTSEVLTAKFTSVRGSAALLTEIVRDRIVGYPNQGWETDQHVPFVDTETGQRKYPLHAELLPRDWQVPLTTFKDAEDLKEYIHERHPEDYTGGFFRLEAASFFFQGNCDPNERNPLKPQYFENCTEAHNDAALGGAIVNTSTLAYLEQKAADIAVFQKLIFELEQYANSVLVYYHNQGAGAVVQYPTVIYNSTLPYMSRGCNWMSQINPNNGEPYATQEEIANCNPPGATQNLRKLNPNDFSLIADFAQHPGETRIFGPFPDYTHFAFDGKPAWKLGIGQAVFDRMTGQYIGATSIDMPLDLVAELLESIVSDNRTNIAIIRMDGTIVAGTGKISQTLTYGLASINITDSNLLDEDAYESLVTLIDWESKWNPDEVSQKFQKHFMIVNTGNSTSRRRITTTAYPVPVPPNTYDPKYYPDFYVLVSAGEEVFDVIDQTLSNVEGEVTDLIVNSVVIAVAGVILFLLMVWRVSLVLTRPLKYMESTATKIVNHQNETTIHSDEEEYQYQLLPCTPQTEISELVQVFQAVVLGFTGRGKSEVAVGQLREVKNLVTWRSDFRQVYNITEENKELVSQDFSEEPPSQVRFTNNGRQLADNSHTINVRNKGSNLRLASRRAHSSKGETALQYDLSARGSVDVTGRCSVTSNHSEVSPELYWTENDRILLRRSSLFRWIFGWIVFPLMLTIILISVLVSSNILGAFPQLLQVTKSVSLDLELGAIGNTASQREYYAQEKLQLPLDNLYALARTSGWLLFDSVRRSDSLTETETEFAEDCKRYPGRGVCVPVDLNETRTPCDCKWNDGWAQPCNDLGGKYGDTRYLQKALLSSQKRDYDPFTGDFPRAVGFPQLDYSANTTSWWTNTSEMPGAWKGSNASGYETAYDRFRVVTAVSSIVFPLYNYINTDYHQKERPASSYFVAFDADGMLWGYSGCNYIPISRSAHFESNYWTNAFLVNPDLCPLGKFGYDSRCQHWYNNVKLRYQESEDMVLFDEPYRHSTVDGASIGQSAAMPLFDPNTKEFVGITFVEFLATAFFYSIVRTRSDFHFITRPQAPADGDTIVGPGHAVGDPKAAIADVVLPHDSVNSTNRERFAKIINEMKSGSDGQEWFSRTTAEGTEERIFVSYLPVHVRVLKPTQADDFKRGGTPSKTLIYSVAVAVKEETVRLPFKEVEDKMNDEFQKIIIVYLSCVAFITLLTILITLAITVAVTRPMIILLRVVKQVNTHRLEKGIPPMMGGSREINKVHSSFAKLYKIVRMSNISFFSGDMERAYQICCDALKLFRKISDERAVAIASNNIGNTLLALSMDKKGSGQCIHIDDGGCLVTSALELYNESINIGTRHFEQSDSDAMKADFAQQLADRHFNRALFLMHSLDDDCSPEHAKDMAFNDLFRCREYDRGVRDFYLRYKLMLKYSGVYFDRLMRRIHGLAILMKIENRIVEVWNPMDLIDEADLMLQAAFEHLDATMFEKVKKVGRLQQLESAAIHVEMNSGNFEEAGRHAMRMFIEDEYILASSFQLAGNSLLRFMRMAGDSLQWGEDTVSNVRRELRKMEISQKKQKLSLDTEGTTFIFCISLLNRHLSVDQINQINAGCLAIYDEHCQPADSIGVVSIGANGVPAIVGLSEKGKNQEDQRDAIDHGSKRIIENSDSTCSALPAAVDMTMHAASTALNDVLLIYVGDGLNEDARSFAEMQKNIELSNNPKDSPIAVIALGLDGNQFFIDDCKNLCLATPSCHFSFLDARGNLLDRAFERATSMISSPMAQNLAEIRLGITMEKF